MKKLFAMFFICLLFTSLEWGEAKVKPGIEVLLERKINILKGKRVGLITNPTGVDSKLRSTVDLLSKRTDVKLMALFGPEHGVRGDIKAGETIKSFTDKKTGLPVYSLYGKTKKPTKEMLKGLDVLIYDIQDIGIRPYTYIYTMALAMEAAKENELTFIVLDRPNPLGGNLVEGPVLEEKFKSFIGLYPIPYVYGMTVGELADFINNEFKIFADLVVVEMEEWKRDMIFPDTGLEWVPTSPHVPHWETAFFCAATGGIGELDRINVGVGYTMPFELIGAPWVEGEKLADMLNQFELPGVYFRPLYYRPYYFYFSNIQLSGVQMHVYDFRKFRPFATQIYILYAINKLFPESNLFETKRIGMFNKAMGTDKVVKYIRENKKPEWILSRLRASLQEYLDKREKYLRYK